MRWSSLNCLFIFLLTSVSFDGIVAHPLPDSNGLYRRTPPPPKAPQRPPPHPDVSRIPAPRPAPPALLHTPVARRTRSASSQPPNQNPAPALNPPHPHPPPPPVRGASSSTNHYNLRPPAQPRVQNVQNTAVQGQTRVPPPSRLPLPKGRVTTADLRSSTYRAHAIKQGLVYSPGQDKIVHRTSTPNTLKTLHADHGVELQSSLAAYPDLNTPQRAEVKGILNGPKNVVLTRDKTNVNKGSETGHAIRGESSNITPGTQRYMNAVASQPNFNDVVAAVDRVGGGSNLRQLQEKIAKKTGTKPPK